ncbi:SusD/RagB family nutrient-binding outer membrane lipoprotein [Elizabethkingia occulta]|uniref:Susd and RagB outer membrane lipoprotein domain protein n=1 Tax=Elizabethkingia occulta TaxID=1867263 RepID=A0A1T3MMY3_9FLAO|nr:SusD/RagB family nutrient-binding outer membrane lipoprotein [Elizabethkingia occulta]OPB96601.1 hypothetical protein BB020_16190 [Elizabethkingia occulta]OPC65789.1 hypothetical protein BAZ10_00685 [Elizabethkingia occulta]
MKKYIIKTSLLFSALAFLSGCNTSDMNTDPNSFYSAKPETLVTFSQKALGDYLNTPGVNTNNFRLVMQYWQEASYADESNYDFVTRNISNNVWQANYRDVLQNLVQAKDIINKYQPTPSELATWPGVKKNQLAVIDILQCIVFGDMVDTFGDVPYKAANDLAGNPLPAYDKAADIYTDLIARVTKDIADLDTSFASFGNADVIYKGSPGQWKKFGNSLLLKFGITLADANPSLAKSTIDKAIAGGVFASASDSALLPYEIAAPNFNQLYQNLKASGRNDFVGAVTLINSMKANNDPRISAYYQPTKSGEYIGAPIGITASFATQSHIGMFGYTPNTPGTILTYTEVAFYLAEVAARWNPAQAPAAYQNAVKASFKEWGYTDADANTYIASKPYDATNWKKSIGDQAWVAMYNQPNVSWNFWKRLDYPTLTAPPTAVSQAEGKVPVRLQYPVRETTTNPSNYAAAAAAIGGDKLTTKVFWDKN